MARSLEPPAAGDCWAGLTEGPLPIAVAHDWAVLPSCGAVVLFTGTVRDHAAGRPGVHELEYEAYVEQALRRFEAIAAAARSRWADLGRVVLLHRTGRLDLREVSVVVVVSAPHRAEAFEAARFCIDALKATAPIWKLERWAGGEAWGLDGRSAVEVGDLS